MALAIIKKSYFMLVYPGTEYMHHALSLGLVYSFQKHPEPLFQKNPCPAQTATFRVRFSASFS